MDSFPSRITHAAIQTNNARYVVQIPQREIFRIENIFSRREYAIPSRYLPNPHLTVVDIGANVGLFALFMKLIAPQSSIHCFEPVNSTLALLRANLNQMAPIYIHPYGLSNKVGRARMVLHPYNTGENSLKYHPEQGCRATDIELRDAGQTVDGLRLDTIDVLKIDTEGCEVEILESLGGRLPKIGVVLLEYHSESDRRRIDHLLKGFFLFEAKVAQPGLGIVKYVNTQIAAASIP